MALRLLETKTRFFDQDTFGMDKNTAYWGWMKYFLDQTLVDGSTPIDVVSISVREEDLYWLFDLALVEASGYKANLSVVEVFNSTLPILNKIHRVQEVKETQNTITLAILKTDLSLKPNDIPDALGTKVKLAPLGYKKTFEEGLKVVYESANPENKRCYLRVDNGCPVGHNLSMCKFARVSMFSDIKHIDDYEYRLGRLKAPAEDLNYTVCETSIKYVWPHCDLYYDGRGINTYARSLKNFFIIGDDKTFYIYFPNLYYDSFKSECFVFGEYVKLLYKEDPHPFILHEPKYNNILQRNETYNNTFFYSDGTFTHLMSEESLGNFTAKGSTYTESYYPYRQETSSLHNLVPYKNEMSLDEIVLPITPLRDGYFIREGYLRGYRFIRKRITPSNKYAPTSFQIFPELDYLLFISDKEVAAFHHNFSFILRDWE